MALFFVSAAVLMKLITNGSRPLAKRVESKTNCRCADKKACRAWSSWYGGGGGGAMVEIPLKYSTTAEYNCNIIFI